MEKSVNRIELRGNAGQDARVTKVNESSVAKFNIATNETVKDRNGNIREETTWHSIVAWEGKNMPDFTKIKKGTTVSVVGRLRVNKYVNAAGEEKQFYEVLAQSVSLE
ncbi:MAG: single-stranded DNA-binding protein [Bacteroidales bacterium]|jgi:single-strand DNA-binding protein|nr:single-stranded DNA-binding protein [Bacteroidales bacterium]MBO7255946.1 single-stranded DNA-binding protein [Bacteroidales bacterium]MBO7283994.1 single-stranded DNA-binding protein [Bacteroidales bacterium]MBO7323073.1 single-stranded DNA-binding protein [Bacteroidales bacterium]MBQ1280482.1 single-stranded DNA-binding protein [Bacteroidales bacterium]